MFGWHSESEIEAGNNSIYSQRKYQDKGPHSEAVMASKWHRLNRKFPQIMLESGIKYVTFASYGRRRRWVRR